MIILAARKSIYILRIKRNEPKLLKRTERGGKRIDNSDLLEGILYRQMYTFV